MKKLSKKIITLILAGTLILSSCIIVPAKPLKYDTKVAYFKNIPSQSEWEKMFYWQSDIEFYDFDLDENWKTIYYPNQAALNKWNGFIGEYLISKKPTKPTYKVTLKTKKKKNSIKITAKTKSAYEIIYSKKKTFKDSKKIFTNKKHITINNLSKKTKYYIKARAIKKYYFVTGFTVEKIGDEYYRIDFNKNETREETFYENYLYGKYSKTYKIKL